MLSIDSEEKIYMFLPSRLIHLTNVYCVPTVCQIYNFNVYLNPAQMLYNLATFYPFSWHIDAAVDFIGLSDMHLSA